MTSSEDFTEDLGLALATFLLWPPMAGRVSATLLASSEPLTLAELQERLGASVGSISEMTRLLQTTGVIRKIKTPGVRRAQFEWAPDAWDNCAQHFTMQMGQLRDLAARTGAGVDAAQPLLRARLIEMERYYELMNEGIGQLARAYRQLPPIASTATPAELR